MMNSSSVADSSSGVEIIAGSFTRKMCDQLTQLEADCGMVVFDGVGARSGRQAHIDVARAKAGRTLASLLSDSHERDAAQEELVFEHVAKEVDELVAANERLFEEQFGFADVSQDDVASSGVAVPAVQALVRRSVDVAGAPDGGADLDGEPDSQAHPALTRVLAQGAKIQRWHDIAAAGAEPEAKAAAADVLRGVQVLSDALLSRVDVLVQDKADSEDERAHATAQLSRVEEFPAYKDNRPPTPVALTECYAAAKEMLGERGVRVVSHAGLEADDVIGSIATRAMREDARLHVSIVSSDKDFMQLVSRRLTVLHPKSSSSRQQSNNKKNAKAASKLAKTGRSDAAALADAGLAEARALGAAFKVMDEERFQEEYPGLTPSQHIDVLALVGDAADNVPGVASIGVKTAPRLIAALGSVEALVKDCSGTKPSKHVRPKMAEKVRTHAKVALLGKELVTLNTELDLLPHDWAEQLDILDF